MGPAHILEISEPLGHVGLQLGVDLLLVPHEALDVLAPSRKQDELRVYEYIFLMEEKKKPVKPRWWVDQNFV